MEDDLQINKANAKKYKAHKNQGLQHHHTGLKFKDLKLCVAQLAQRGEVQGHGLDGTVGVWVMRPTLWG